MPKLLIVESPKKARTIQKFIGKDWIVKASFGHIRQLAKDGDGKLGFDLVGDQVHCRYIPINKQARENLHSLKAIAAKASLVVLATDRDREGEGISFHLKEALKLKNYQRITYNEVTEKAIREAIASPRGLDHDLVGAALARACLDKLVGYKISPILWQLNIGAKSTGRVQAPTLHIICSRERQIQKFTSEPYWTVWSDYSSGFRAYFTGVELTESTSSVNSERDDTEAIDSNQIETKRVGTEEEAKQLRAIAQSQSHQVVKVESKLQKKNPPPPFTTSSLQQAAGARLKFSPERTMQIAQNLFESGLITYHRTDSTSLSDDYIAAARLYLQEKDPKNLPAQARQFKGKKNAQEAHEAIRPSDLTKSSTKLKQELDKANFALYELIWRRAMASQCNPARIEKTSITTQSGSVYWIARGQVLKFAGYIRYWKDLGKDTELPILHEGDNLKLERADSQKKMTQPPPRYSESKLVQIMERQGIGRPSTYSSTVKTLKERNYVELTKGKLVATELGLQVDSFQETSFPQLISSQFTAEMENCLDKIAHGKLDWQHYLTGWNRDYFETMVKKALNIAIVDGGKAEKQTLSAKKREKSRTLCPKCSELMDKIPSKSKKLSRPYFLKCDRCEVVMFYNSTSKSWVEPGNKSVPVLTENLCPVCNAFLAEKTYSKNGLTKKMLVCSTNSDSKHKDVVFFESRGKWWSPKFGELIINS